jgi:hypothetical protein
LELGRRTSSDDWFLVRTFRHYVQAISGAFLIHGEPLLAKAFAPLQPGDFTEEERS